MFAAIAESAFGIGVLILGNEPKADGDLRAVEKLPRQGNHAINEVCLNHCLTAMMKLFLIGRVNSYCGELCNPTYV